VSPIRDTAIPVRVRRYGISQKIRIRRYGKYIYSKIIIQHFLERYTRNLPIKEEILSSSTSAA